MNAAKLREYYQQTQLLLSELQALGSDSYGIDRANSKHQQLARLAVQLQNGAETLPEQDLRAIWKERFAKLHEDLVSLTALRLQREGQSGEQFWDGCVRLLYAGASAYIQRETELATLQAQESTHEEKRVNLETALQTSTQQRESTSKENLELRTRVVVLQQEIQRRDADARDLQQQLQAVTRERDGLRSEREKLLMDCERSTQALDRQAKVIGQLMERSESSVRERDEAVSTLKQVDEDNHVLRVNLHQHTLVVEKLIGLNTEVMDAANQNALVREKLEKQLTEKLKLEEKTDHNGLGEHEHGPEDSCEDDSVPISTLPLSTLPLSLPQEDNELPASRALDSNGYKGVFHAHYPWSRKAIEGNLVSESSSKTVNTGGDSRRDHHKSFEETNNERTSREEIEKRDQNATEIVSKQTQRPIAWTSDMLELRNKPSLEETQTSNGNNGVTKEEEEENGTQIRPSATMGARSILKGIGGRARGFLSYVAGADNVATVEQERTN